jgi:uncharacterized protein YhfF
MDDELPAIEFAFPGPCRDHMVSAIQSGAKTSMSSLIREYEVGEEALPVVGDRGAVLNSNGDRVAVIETTAVQIVQLQNVPLEHAIAEGEGHLSVSDWRARQTRFWSSPAMRAELGDSFDLTDTSLVVLQQFVIIR